MNSRNAKGEPVTMLRVTLNMAMSLDGKIATSNRAVSSFGSAVDHRHLYELRARADAVMCGARTVNDENADLGTGGARYERMRVRAGLSRQNLRVVISGRGNVLPNARIFREPGGPIIVIVSSRATRSRCDVLEKAGAQIHRCGGDEVDLRKALIWLRRTWKVRTLHCEGGSILNDSLFRLGLVDQIHLTLCPTVIGGRNAPTIADGIGLGSLSKMRRYGWVSTRRIGNEFFWVLRQRGNPRSSTTIHNH